jgi:putative ABC transport system permease protein
MFNKDQWNEIIEALSAKPLRTFITAFGVFWGITILVILLSASTGLENGVKRGFGGMSTNSMFIWTSTTSKPYKGLPQGRYFNYKNSDIDALKREFSQLQYVSPRNQLGGFRGSNNVTRGTKTGAYNVYGDYPEYILQQPMKIIKGRFLNYADINQKRKIAVIGEGIIRELYQPGEEVLAFNYGDAVGWMAITAKDGFPITDLKPKIFELLKERHTIDPNDDRAIGNFDLYAEYSKINGLFGILTAVSYIVGGLILLSGVIGIINIMLIVVKERTKEIGIRRALGATPWDIKKQILTESVVLSLIAGMAGIIFSTFIILMANSILDGLPDASEVMFANPSISLTVVVIALLILVVSGLIAGFIPAQTAIKTKPIDALRTE